MQIIYPQLEGIKINENLTLPYSVIQAIRKAYDYLAQISSASLLGTVVIEDVHANRNTLYPAAEQQLGSFYIETDRAEALYVVQQVKQANQWVLVMALLQGVLAARPTDLGLNDVGFMFRATNALDYRWGGAGWVTLDTVRGGTNLTTVDAVTKVSAAGTITQSSATVSAGGVMNVTASYDVAGIQVVGAQLAAVTPPTPITTSNTVLTAGATYTATEQSMINALKTAVGQLNADVFVLQTSINDLIARLVTHGLTL